jgi:hypothetical protein
LHLLKTVKQAEPFFSTNLKLLSPNLANSPPPQPPPGFTHCRIHVGGRFVPLGARVGPGITSSGAPAGLRIASAGSRRNWELVWKLPDPDAPGVPSLPLARKLVGTALLQPQAFIPLPSYILSYSSHRAGGHDSRRIKMRVYAKEYQKPYSRLLSSISLERGAYGTLPSVSRYMSRSGRVINFIAVISYKQPHG